MNQEEIDWFIYKDIYLYSFLMWQSHKKKVTGDSFFSMNSKHICFLICCTNITSNRVNDEMSLVFVIVRFSCEFIQQALHTCINNSVFMSDEIFSQHCTETLYKLLFVFPEPFLTLGGVFCTAESVSLFSIFLSCFFFILLIFAVFLIWKRQSSNELFKNTNKEELGR